MRCVHSDWLRQCVQSPDSTACGPKRALLPFLFAIPCPAQPRIPYTRLNHLSPSRSPLSILLYCASWQKSLQTRSPLVAVQLFDCDQPLRGEFTLPGGRDVGWVTGYTVISPYQRLLSRHCFMYESFPPTYLSSHIFSYAIATYSIQTSITLSYRSFVAWTEYRLGL